MDMGAIIKEKRVQLGITQKELAEHLGIHMQLVSNLERNLCPFPLKHMFLLIDKLELDEKWFIDSILNEKKQKFLESVEEYRKQSA